MRTAAALVAAALAIAAVLLVAKRRSRPPQHCAEGLQAFGARCCGEGQRLEGSRCLGRPIACPGGMKLDPRGCVVRAQRVDIAGGRLELAPTDWEADGRTSRLSAEVPSFAIDSHEVTEADYHACIVDEHCTAHPGFGPEHPAFEPGRPRVDVSAEEAAVFCRWRGGSLPTREQWVFAAAGAEGRRYPWGQTGAVCRRAAFGLKDGPCAHGAVGPALAGAHLQGGTPEGVYDLAGNAAEWTVPVDGRAAVHGGSWADQSAADLRVWSFRQLPGDERLSTVGFRCAYHPHRNTGAQ